MGENIDFLELQEISFHVTSDIDRGFCNTIKFIIGTNETIATIIVHVIYLSSASHDLESLPLKKIYCNRFQKDSRDSRKSGLSQ